MMGEQAVSLAKSVEYTSAGKPSTRPFLFLRILVTLQPHSFTFDEGCVE